VISVGFENSYGLPNRDVIERLRQHRAVVYRTDQDGLITVRERRVSAARRDYFSCGRIFRFPGSSNKSSLRPWLISTESE
jgi:hypothetical protein